MSIGLHCRAVGGRTVGRAERLSSARLAAAHIADRPAATISRHAAPSHGCLASDAQQLVSVSHSVPQLHSSTINRHLRTVPFTCPFRLRSPTFVADGQLQSVSIALPSPASWRRCCLVELHLTADTSAGCPRITISISSWPIELVSAARLSVSAAAAVRPGPPLDSSRRRRRRSIEADSGIH